MDNLTDETKLIIDTIKSLDLTRQEAENKTNATICNFNEVLSNNDDEIIKEMVADCGSAIKIIHVNQTNKTMLRDD